MFWIYSGADSNGLRLGSFQLLKRILFCLLVVPGYWLAARWLLQRVVPISWDSAGPVATLYWGENPPTPNTEEYFSSVAVRRRFQYPYWTCAFVVTCLGCQPLWLIRSHRPFGAVAASLGLLLISGGVSDAGNVIGLWRGPMMFADLIGIRMLLEVSLPMSMLTGLLTWTRDQLD